MSPWRPKPCLAGFVFLAVLVAFSWAFLHDVLSPNPFLKRESPLSVSVSSTAEPNLPGDRSSPEAVRGFPSQGGPARSNSAVFIDDPDLFRKNIEETLALSVREKVPGLRLSAEEMRELAREILIIRETFRGLRMAGRTPENAAYIKALAGQLDESDRIIREMTGMSTAEFLIRMTTEGIDNDKPEKGEVVLEYLHPPGR